MFSLLENESPTPGLHESRVKWESELKADEQLWADLCQDSLSTTVNAQYRLKTNNSLYQFYLTPEKNDIYSNLICQGELQM